MYGQRGIEYRSQASSSSLAPPNFYHSFPLDFYHSFPPTEGESAYDWGYHVWPKGC